MSDENHTFGVPTKFSGNLSKGHNSYVTSTTLVDTKIKDLVNPPVSDVAPPEAVSEFHTMYIKSHRSFAPGEQFHRNYIWKTDPTTHVWGAPSDQGNAEESVKESLVSQEERERYVFTYEYGNNIDHYCRNLRTKITTKRVQDFREKTHHKLGKPLDV